VAKQLLDGTQVGAAFQQVRGEAVAQGMRGDTGGERGLANPEREAPGHVRAVQPATALGEEQRRLARYTWQACASFSSSAGGRVAPLPSGGATLPSREELTERALATGDEHAIKFTEVGGVAVHVTQAQPADEPARVSYEKISAVMGPGFATPFNVVVVSDDEPITDRAMLRKLEAFQEEIAAPLGLDFYIRLPEFILDLWLATFARPGMLEILRGFPFRFALVAFNPRSNIARALRGSEFPLDARRVYARDFEVPSGGGVGTAHAIARAYGVFATGGKELGLRRETLDALSAPAVPPSRGFYDECMKGEAKFSLGFMKPSRGLPFGSPSAFGSPGAGGAMGFADPEAGVGYAYVTSKMGTTLSGDPRDVALRDALYSALADS